MGGNGSEKIERIGKKKYNTELFRLQFTTIVIIHLTTVTLVVHRI